MALPSSSSSKSSSMPCAPPPNAPYTSRHTTPSMTECDNTVHAVPASARRSARYMGESEHHCSPHAATCWPIIFFKSLRLSGPSWFTMPGSSSVILCATHACRR